MRAGPRVPGAGDGRGAQRHPGAARAGAGAVIDHVHAGRLARDGDALIDARRRDAARAAQADVERLGRGDPGDRPAGAGGQRAGGQPARHRGCRRRAGRGHRRRAEGDAGRPQRRRAARRRPDRGGGQPAGAARSCAPTSARSR